MIDNKILGKSILHASLITALSVLCSIGIRVDLDSVFNYSYNIDSDVTDFYTRVAESRSVKTLVKDIRFVDIGVATRGQIAETLMEIEKFNPAIIGLDVQFIEQHFDADDSFLEEVIVSNDNIIIATNASAESPQSFFYDNVPASRRGFINLGNEMEMVRKYQVKRVLDYDTLFSFPAQIVKGYNPEAFSKLMKRGNGAEYIKYPSKMFYEPYAYFQVPQIGKELTGKIVLVGDILGNSDEHFTPIHPRMKGLMIHAYSVASILDGNYINVSNGVGQWILAVILIFFIVSFRMYMVLSNQPMASFYTDKIQWIALFFSMYVGYLFFVKHNIYLNVHLGMLCAASIVWSNLWEFGIYINNKVAVCNHKNVKQ